MPAQEKTEDAPEDAAGFDVVSNLRQRVRVLARQLGVRMLIIDEIHSMLSGTFREQRIFLNALRFLANDLHLLSNCT